MCPVVFGWFQDSYEGCEEEHPHEVLVGYQKGAQQPRAHHDLTFTINERIGRFVRKFAMTAIFSATVHYYYREVICIYHATGPSSDLIVLNSEVRINGFQPSIVNVSFLVDGVAQEYNETVTLVLVPLPTTPLPTGEAVFFLNTTDMIIIDADRKYSYPAAM